MMISGGTVRMANMIFQDNVTRGMGGAIHVVNASLIADDCQFLDNQADGSGGAIAVGGTNPGLVLRDVDLRGNVSGGEGGGLYVTSSSAGASVSLQNVVIAQNTAGGRGGAAALRDVDCTIVAATVAANQAGSGAGAIDVANTSACALINSIAWNPSTLPELSGLTNVDHCLVRGDNLASQPSFASYPADLHLTATSPALDAAKACAGPALDRDGAPRVDIPGAPNTSAAASDIGAYELQTGGSATQPFDVLCP
jgi:predicted outer membrane repeat protein